MARKSIKDIEALVDAAPVDEPIQTLVSRDDLYNNVTAPIIGLTVDDMIKDLTDSDGLVPVTVLVSHDNFYAGTTVRLPPSERLVSLIISGWVEA